jgi:Na+-driven multidrug efflux pump
VFRGLGETRTALGITVFTFAANAALLPFAIPLFGIAGAAWSTVLASAFGATVGLVWLTAEGRGPIWAPPRLAALGRIAGIGGPVSASGIAFSCVYVVLGRLIVAFGDQQVAGLGLGHRLEGLAYQVCVAFEVGAATLVGQHVGARDPDGARRAVRQAAVTCCAIMLPAAATLFLAAPTLVGAFASTEATITAGSAYLRTQTVVFVFMAMEAVYGGAFAGAGRTVVPFWIVSLGTLVRLPLAWVLAWPLGLGVQGIWIAIALSTFGKGVASAWAWGRWKG